QRVCAAADCGKSFASRGEVDEHRRSVHQVKVTVTHSGQIHKVYRSSDGTFHCPLGSCEYRNANSRYLLDHCNRYCKGVGPVIRNPVGSAGGSGVIIPAGEEIEVHEALVKYNLVWNKRCKILICVNCSIGVPPAEVLAHYRRENQPCMYNKEQVSRDLVDYVDMVEGNVTPPGYELGQACEPVQGLVSYNGYTCKLCNLTWPSQKSIGNHFSSTH
ncbi:hypothetical protein DFH28DRAFT_858017, partial [Melampsora americana]